MLIIALVLAVIGLAALVTAVVTSNELIAWVCIGASVIGVLLLIIDAVRERSHKAASGDASDDTETTVDTEPVDYPDEDVEDEDVESEDEDEDTHDEADEAESVDSTDDDKN